MLLGAAAMSLVFAMGCGWGMSLEEGHNENGSQDWPGVHRRHPGHVDDLWNENPLTRSGPIF